MKTKEDWVAATMESLDGIHSAEGDPLLFGKIMGKLQKKGPKVLFISPSLLLKMAAGLALLISVNVVTLFVYSRTATSGKEISGNPLASEYFTYIKTITPNP